MKIYHKVEPPTRITRARAAASNASMGVLPPKPPTKTLRATSKRLASDENSASSSVTAGIHCKRRAVLKDVTNICCENLYKGCISAAKVQTKNFKQEKRLPVKNGPKVVADLAARTLSVEEDACHMRPNELEKKGYTQSQVVTLPVKLGRNASIKRNMESTKSKCAVALPQLEELVSRKPSQHIRFSIEEKGKHCKSSEYEVGVINIDSDQKNPQMCSLYAPEIYRNLRVKELTRRPSSSFMETLQQDISESMRRILIDWLVEVSEEYKLTADTLYLSVYLIDRFLSQSYIERQLLQLLGITCMLIASKYEEVCAPHVEEFCFITDNTYTTAEVLKMESRVLNFLGFHLSVPTVRTFLRRYL